MLRKIIIICLSLPLLTSCLRQSEGRKIPGISGPYINLQAGKIILSATIENLNIDAGATVQIPGMKNSSVTFGPEYSQGIILKFTVDPNDVRGIEVADPTTLPDGRDFPFLADGKLPALAIHLPKVLKSTVYASNKLFGFFIPVKFPTTITENITFRLKVNGKSIGVVSAILPDPVYEEGSGVVLVLTLDQITQNPEFKQLLKYSEKHKNLLF